MNYTTEENFGTVPEFKKDKTKIYLDLYKLSEEEIKSVAKILINNNERCYQGLINCLSNGDYNKTFYLLSFFKRSNLWDFGHRGLESTVGKTKVTFGQFKEIMEGETSKKVLQVENDWIKIESEKDLPKEEGEYLVYKKFNDTMEVSYFDLIQWGYYSKADEAPTHWTYLPEPPKF